MNVLVRKLYFDKAKWKNIQRQHNDKARTAYEYSEWNKVSLTIC